ncbi:MAG: hypothetical protein ABUK01_17470 [Leptospirales bacterium]
MKKIRYTYLLLVLLPFRLDGADLRLMHGALFSTFLDTDNQSSGEVTYIESFPLHVVGYYFLDTRLQNLGKSQWMTRFNAYLRSEFLQGSFDPDIRNFYIENRKPVGGNWYFAAGRMRSPYLNPMYRVDGLLVGFKPKEKSPLTLGIYGGMRPLEESGFVDFRYKPYIAGSFVELKGKRQDQIRLMYNVGFDDTGFGANSEIDHQFQFQGVKAYRLFKKDCFFRVGALAQTPMNIFDYAYVENTIFSNKSTSHSLSYIRSEAIFLIGKSLKEERVLFQESVYRLHTSPERSLWKVAFSGGYSYSQEQHGYVVQTRVQRNQTFMKKGTMWVDAAARDRGYYRQIYGKVGYGIYPLGFVNLDLALGYENVLYRIYGSHAILAEINLDSSIGTSLDFSINADFRFLTTNNTETYITATLIHYMGWKIGPKKTNDELPKPE